MPIKLNTASGGGVILTGANTASDRTITVPAVDGTMITTASTFAGTGPAFSAYASTTTSANHATSTKVNLVTELFDTNSNFASSRFTPTVAGYYQFNFCVRMESVTSLEAQLYVNGSFVAAGSSVASGNWHSSGSHLVYLNGSTDYAELYVVQYSGTTQTVTASQQSTRLSGFLARAA